jgi:hypothetical protein
MNLWIVGRLRPHTEWEFIGVFSDEALAVAACTSEEHFVGPTLLDVAAPDAPTPWPDAYRPHHS